MIDVGGLFLFIMINLLKVVALFILFSPAYIIAYSLRSSFEGSGYTFMIVLGLISNGLLINYSYKFYTFLIHESKKGYVQTAFVKGLSNNYNWNVKDGIEIKSLFRIKKYFPGHVFNHIYSNARYQYLPTIKQYASFMITGLIIIEMALNIQGHLCYKLMKDILYRQYDSALIIIFGIFLVVKLTEILIDCWFYIESKRYENY
jgi:ABC-type dipeptide/oligopeptide/nickel transport system permease component